MILRRSIHAKLDRLLEGNAWLIREAKKMSAALDNLAAQEAATEAAISAAIEDIAALTAKVEAAASGDDSAALTELAAKLKAKTDALNAAVNQPAPAAAS